MNELISDTLKNRLRAVCEARRSRYAARKAEQCKPTNDERQREEYERKVIHAVRDLIFLRRELLKYPQAIRDAAGEDVQAILADHLSLSPSAAAKEIGGVK